jgi:SAM-dependent methyltransferase
MDRSALAYWESFAAGRFRSIPTPIVPAEQDIEFLESRIRTIPGGNVEALLFGVTPRIATMRWPAGTSLIAIDWSRTMIRDLWPLDGLPHFARPLCADWRQLPLAAASRTLVVGDGCYTAIGTLADAAIVNEQVHRVLRPDGLYCLRCFCRPAQPLALGDLYEELHAGRISNVFMFRWLLAMAVHGASREGVVLDAVWREWNRRVPDSRGLFARCGWPEDAAWSIERWKGLSVRFSFPDAAEVHELAAPHFDVLEFHVPDYEFGECFPSVVMRARRPPR